MLQKKKTHWVVTSVQHVAHDGAVVTLHAGHGQAFDCRDLERRWPRAK
jgi:hypothetical protein